MQFDQLSRRDCITLLAASVGGLMRTRPAYPQEIFKALPAGDYGPWGFDLTGADFETRPGHDFFRYANGAWFDRAGIAPDRDTNGVDTQLADIAESRIRDILMRGEIGVELATREDARKIGMFYANFMDEARVEALDAEPLAPFIEMLRRADSRADLAGLMAKTFFGSILSLSIGIDAKAPDKYAVVVDQGGLGFPDRDYYLVAHFSRCSLFEQKGCVPRLYCATSVSDRLGDAGAMRRRDFDFRNCNRKGELDPDGQTRSGKSI
jgi:predicted metalloendopeptidase